MTAGVTLSVVVNTYDRAATLKDTLLSLAQLDGPDFEVIVVNGPSTDGTADLLLTWPSPIKTAECPDENLSKSRNIGLSLASGDVVAFIDDDAVPHPRWLLRLAEHFSDPAVAAAGGFTVGRHGRHFQAQKVVCDRYGDAYYVGRFFDERVICRPNSWIFPSLLGTNASFRRTALESIGGFDEVFAYFLDETDVCVRLMDAGWKIRFEPTALVWHQYAGSHLRNDRAVPSSLLAITRSKAYFASRHGTKPWSLLRARAAIERVQQVERQYHQDVRNLLERGLIEGRTHAKLEREIREGIEEGVRLAYERQSKVSGDWCAAPKPAVFARTPKVSSRLRICFVSRHLPPISEAGIARWTWLLAHQLAARGHSIHLITENDTPSIRFRDGVWVHSVARASDGFDWLVERCDLPHELASWAEAVRRHVELVKSFGLDVISFPIWDLEGIACLGDDTLLVNMSLHTSYGLARPHKAEWLARPLFREAFVNRVVAAERLALERADMLLANSRAVVDDLQILFGLDLTDRTNYAVHGTPVPAPHLLRVRGRDEALKVLFVGRFESRKGLDIALRAVETAIELGAKLQATFIGGERGDVEALGWLEDNLLKLATRGVVTFKGFVPREELDAAYAASDVILMPSRYESFGLVAIEAMAHGRPVLALAEGGLPEVVIDGQTGFTTPLDEGAARILGQRLVALYADPQRLLELSRSARAHVEEKYSLETMAHQVETAFTERLCNR